VRSIASTPTSTCDATRRSKVPNRKEARDCVGSIDAQREKWSRGFSMVVGPVHLHLRFSKFVWGCYKKGQGAWANEYRCCVTSAYALPYPALVHNYVASPNVEERRLFSKLLQTLDTASGRGMRATNFVLNWLLFSRLRVPIGRQY